MVLALRSFLRIAAGDKLLFWDTSQAGENLANHLVDDLIQNVHSVAGLPGAIRLLAEFSVAGVANAERIVQSTIGELTPFPAGRQGEPCTTVAAVNVIGKQCLSTGTKRNMVFGFFRCVGRAIFPDTLCSFKLLLRDDLEFGHQFGAGISAAENAHVGQVADHSSQAARMPALSRAGTVSSIVQIGGNPLCAVTLVYIFIEDQPNDFGFLLVDMQFVEFVLALVDAATFHKVITIRRTAALEVSFFHKLPQAGTGTDRSFFAFAVCLPEADIVQQFVSVVVESLLTLLGTPYPDVALRFYGFSQPSQIDLSLPYDIALLDIDMGETNGIELARKLRAENENIVIIFITNFIQYAPEGFEVQAFRYLLKADFSAKLDSYFDSAVQEVLQRKQLVTISINSEIIDVPVNDILYLESHRRIIVMHLLDEKRPAYQFYGNITELSEKIEPLGFLRIQKSYLVNMHYVEIFQYNKVQLRGGLCLAPSEKNYNELKQKYLHWRGKSRWML